MNKKKSLFPYALLRVAGGPINDLEKLNCKQSIVFVEKIYTLEQKLQEVIEILSKDLYVTIPRISEKDYRKQFIKARRDIYNKRSIDYLSTKIIPQSLKININVYVNLLERIKELNLQGEAYYNREVKQIRREFKRLLRQPNLQNGILLSTDTVFDELKRYITCNNTTNSGFSKIEETLLKYLIRMYTKPTPFSTFTSLGIAKFGKSNADMQLENVQTKSHIRLNNAIYGYLYNLLVKNKDVRKEFPIVLNDTVKVVDGQYVFFTINNTNEEAFQRINKTPALEYFFNTITKKKKWRYNDFIAYILSKNELHTTKEEIEAFVDQLLSYGMFEYNIGISGLDENWDEKLIHVLSPLSSKFTYLQDFIQALQKIKKLSQQYAVSSTQERASLLHEAFIILKEVCYKLHVAADLPENERSSFQGNYLVSAKDKLVNNPTNESGIFAHIYNTAFFFKPKNLWYEDIAFATTQMLPKKVSENVQLLTDFLLRMMQFDGCAIKREYITDFFKKHYSINEEIDLLTFYEEYCKSVKTKENNIEHNEITQQRLEKNKKWLDALVNSLQSQLHRMPEEIHISLKDLPPLSFPNNLESFSAYIQVCKDKNSSRLVINETAPGYGKTIGRFLYLFDPSVMKAIKSRNSKKSSGVLFGEPVDASVFNADIHPSLVRYTLPLTYQKGVLSGAHIIHLKDIVVVYKKDMQKLVLFDKKRKKELYLFNFGLQNIITRLGLYEFLTNFTPGNHCHYTNILDHIDMQIKKLQQNEETYILPRIMYEKSIVLQRKSWIFAKKDIPKRDNNENDWTYFLKIQQWKKKYNLPDEVFVRIKQQAIVKNRDNHKPQYIQLNNPFLILLFELVVKRTNTQLYIEEMLPNTNDIMHKRNKKMIMEVLIQQ